MNSYFANLITSSSIFLSKIVILTVPVRLETNLLVINNHKNIFAHSCHG